MPRGNYKIEVIRYHESLPEGVPLLFRGKNGIWGYKVQNTLGKIPLSPSYETLIKNFLITQINVESERVHMSLDLTVEDLEGEDIKSAMIHTSERSLDPKKDY